VIIYAIGLVVRTLFIGVVSLVRALFGSVWTTLATKVSEFGGLPGVGTGLALVNMFVGLDFVVWATGLAVTIVITIRMIRLILGLFSKA
jgi:hypothetical protein